MNLEQTELTTFTLVLMGRLIAKSILRSFLLTHHFRGQPPQPINKINMKTEQALQILKEALHIAIAKGCYGLIETTNIVKAIEYFENKADIEFGDIEELN